MNSPNYSSSVKVCPRDNSVNHVNATACAFCGGPLSDYDVQPMTSLKVCPVCGTSAGAAALSCVRCRNPFIGGPSPTGNYQHAYPRPNFSNVYALPPNVKSTFNWGACFFTWIWGLNHRKPETLLAILAGFIPFGALIASIYIGYKGNEWAWDSGRFQTIDDMQQCQVIWAKWALWMFVLSIVAPLAIFMLILVVGGILGSQH